MNCERCETCEPSGVYLLRFADASQYFRLCADCLDLYRYAIHGEEDRAEDDDEEEGDPCEVLVDEIVESAEDPE